MQWRTILVIVFLLAQTWTCGNAFNLRAAGIVHNLFGTSTPRVHAVPRPATTTEARFHKSEALGISRCRLPGVLGTENVILHVWLRLAPPAVASPRLCMQRSPPVANCNQTGIAKGFALLQSVRKSIPYYNRAGIQLLQAASLLLFSQKLYLRSPLTGAEYPLHVTIPFSKHINSSYFGNESHAGSTKEKYMGQGWTSHVMDVGGLMSLLQEDVQLMEFQLHAVGFDFSCNVLVQPPVLGLEEEEGTNDVDDDDDDDDDDGGRSSGGSSSSADDDDGGDVRGGAGGHSDQGMTQKHLLQQGMTPSGASPPHLPHSWTHHNAASLTNKTQVWQVLSPFHNIRVSDYATMLWHRVVWHAQLGVSRYILFVDENLGPLLREPMIQDLVSRGILHLVFYTEMPKHEEMPLQPTQTDIYVMQVLAYNHALLALWGSDSLVLVADVDEYVITHKPMSVVDAFLSCRNGSVVKPPWMTSNNMTIKAWMLKKLTLAGLQVRRTDAVCAPTASPEQCSTTTPGLSAWLNTDVNAVAGGHVPHPLTWHGMTSGEDMWGHYNVKMLVDPNLARDFHVHTFERAPGSLREHANTSCLRLLHLVDLYRVRGQTLVGLKGTVQGLKGEDGVQEEGPVIRPAVVDSVTGGDHGWWWPAQALMAGKGILHPQQARRQTDGGRRRG